MTNGLQPNARPYVVIIGLGMVLGVIAALTVTFARPEADNAILIATTLGFIGTMTTSVLAVVKTQETKETLGVAIQENTDKTEAMQVSAKHEADLVKLKLETVGLPGMRLNQEAVTGALTTIVRSQLTDLRDELLSAQAADQERIDTVLEELKVNTDISRQAFHEANTVNLKIAEMGLMFDKVRRETADAAATKVAEVQQTVTDIKEQVRELKDATDKKEPPA